MFRSKSLLFLCLISALAVGAVAASSASAVTGYTAFTCKNVGGTSGTFTKAHCKKEDAGAGAWRHAAPTTHTNTAVTVTNGNTAVETGTFAPHVLKGQISGLPFEISCTTVASEEGTLSNMTNGEEMYIQAEGKLKYQTCVVLQPSGRFCVVTGGSFTTNKLRATTKSQGMNILIEPAAGSEIAGIPISECTNNIPPTATYPVTGSLKVTEIESAGSTLVSTHAEVTMQGTLLFGGQPAGFNGPLTIKGPSGDGVSATTPPYLE